MPNDQNVKMTNDNWPKCQMIIGLNAKTPNDIGQNVKMPNYICGNIKMPNDN
jgi:hypothetical protein